MPAAKADVAEPIRIANCSGYFGDRPSAAWEMVHGGPIDVLTGDWLAELTMLILARIRAKRQAGGFASTFVTQMEQVMGTCLDQGIRVVANAGGLDPDGCADAVAEVADELGLSPTIAWIGGDDLTPRLDELRRSDSLRPFGDQPLMLDDILTANAYLGCWGIVEALDQGADIVITGRVTDAAVVCGPAAWHHGWERHDWDSLAGAVAAGHVIECSAQATGGNYSFFTEIEGRTDSGGRARFGHPWAEIAEDGSALIGKHAGTGGEVSIGTVTSQLLYEIGDPAYLGPDVTSHFDALELEQADPDRVLISGATGSPPPATLKVATNRLGGYRNSVTLGVTGLDIEAKAELCEAVFWDAYPYSGDELDEVVITLSRTDRPDPETNDQATARWTVTVKDADADKVGRAFSNAVFSTALASIPGMHSLSGGPRAAEPFGVYQPATILAELVPQYVHVAGHETAVIDSAAPAGAQAQIALAEPASPPAGPTTPCPLGTVVGARSGDKGGDANLGVFARTDVAFAWLDDFLTVGRLQELLPEVAPLEIDRYRLPKVRALNFVIHGLLGDGVAASTRPDAQAKSLGEWLRARVVDLPDALL